MTKLLEKAESLPEFVLSRLVQEYGLTLDGKRRIVEELQPLVKAAVSPLQRSVFVSHFAEKLGMPMEQLNGHLDSPPVNRGASPVPPVKKVREERIVPLSIPQRQLVEFMILQPKFFSGLEDGGIRQCLAGGVGEVLFLQLRGLLAQNPDAEPEELLTLLPGGAERNLVADLLLRAPDSSQGDNGDESRQDFSELLDYLKRYRLKKSSEELMERMQRAEQDGDSGLWQELMVKKIEITNKLQGEQA